MIIELISVFTAGFCLGVWLGYYFTQRESKLRDLGTYKEMIL